MTRFTTTALAGGSVLVEGTDVRGNKGEEVLNGAFWNAKRLEAEAEAAVKLVDDAIAELVAPITAAVEEANRRLARPSLDPLFYVVEQEAVEATPGKAEQLVKLDRDSVILRAIEQGQEDRLIWVAGKLTVTAAAPAPVPSVVDVSDSVGDTEPSVS